MPATFHVALVLLATWPAAALRAQPAPPTRAEALLAAARRGHRPLDCAEVTGADAPALATLGDSLRGQSLERATEAYRLEVEAARCAGADAQTGAALNQLGTVLNLRGLNDEAAAVALESERIHERLHDDNGLAQAWNLQANIAWGHGEMHAALAQYERALALWTRTGDQASRARALANIGNVRRALGEFEAALDSYSRALEVFDDAGDAYRAAVVTDNIGIAYFTRGDYATALEYSRRALDRARSAGERQTEAKCLDSMANEYRALGAYQLALQAFEQALQLRIAVDDKPGVMETQHNIGLVHFSQGDFDLAIDAYKRSLRLNRVLRARSFEAEALRNIGTAAWRLGQRERAAANFRASLAIARRDGLRMHEGELIHDLGQLALSDGRRAEALRRFDEALSIRRDIGDRAGITESLTSLAETRIAAGQYRSALTLAQEAIDGAVAHDQPELLWRAQTTAGRALRRLGRAADARRLFGDAIEGIERLSAELTASDDFRQRFFEDKLSPYHELIAIAIEERAYGDALALAERSKARVLAQLLNGSRADPAAYLTAADRQERSRLRDALAAVDRQIETEGSQPALDDGRLRTLESARHDAREALAAFDSAFVARHPELAALRGRVAALGMADAHRVVRDPDTAVVEYVVDDRRLFAFVATTDGSRVSVDARAIDVDAGTLSARAEQFRARIASRELDVAAAARALYDLLLGPFGPRLAGKTRLVIVPDGPLWNVPFQALRSTAGYVIETTAVSYAPSLTVLREIERLPAPSGAPTLLAMGKATFDATGRAALDPLPDAENQVRRLRDVYGADRSAVYTGAAASEAQFKTSAPHYTVLHLATHGILDASSPLYSHLVLSPDRVGSDDGRLEAWEIMRLKLAANLVVLAACDTARGRISAGEGVVGTMWALLVAGARAMVVSQFRVESTSATALLLAFHRGIAEGRRSKAADLRSAALELLHSPRYSHPYYWAGFIIVGGAD